MRRRTLMGIVLLCGTLSSTAVAFAASSVKLSRCAYVRVDGATQAVYPDHASCPQAKAITTDKHYVGTVESPNGIGGGDLIMRLDGANWVCGGQTGSYWCVYPYRPYEAHGQKSFRGPFSRIVWSTICGGNYSTCPAKASFQSLTTFGKSIF